MVYLQLYAFRTSRVRKTEASLFDLCRFWHLRVLALVMPGHRTGVQSGPTTLKQTVPRVLGIPQTGRKNTNLNVLKLMHLQVSWYWEWQPQEAL